MWPPHTYYQRFKLVILVVMSMRKKTMQRKLLELVCQVVAVEATATVTAVVVVMVTPMEGIALLLV